MKYEVWIGKRGKQKKLLRGIFSLDFIKEMMYDKFIFPPRLDCEAEPEGFSVEITFRRFYVTFQSLVEKT